MTAKPTSVRLRAYNVGFGDCLLLTVMYSAPLADGRSERHMLLDMGTKAAMDGGPSLSDIAPLIEQHCAGRLDVVVATHRHQDHISGFGIKKVSHILDRLQPGVVVRPWTDVPQADSGDPALGLDARSQRFVAALDGLQKMADNLQMFEFDDTETANRAAELASLGFKNGPAIAVLEAWGHAGRAEFVKTGDLVKIDKEMPGVKVRVLGPPTLADVPNLTSYAKSSDEYWLQLAIDDAIAPTMTAVKPDAEQHALDVLADPGGKGAAAWLVRSLNNETIPHGLEIVEGFDDVLNNTSVILLVTIGKRTLLLAGDAQAENWSLTLETALGENGRKENVTLRRQLSNIDVYKVGHHGSRNATPVSLYELWKPRAGSTHPLVSILTTKKGVFDKSKEGEVPKPNLVKELGALGALHNTDDLLPNVWWMDIESPTVGNANFVFSQGPAMT